MAGWMPAISHGDDYIEINGRRIDYVSERSPDDCRWGQRGIDLVMECTGIFTDAEKAASHINAGAGRVLVSAPAKGADATIVYGVNHDILTPEMKIISERILHNKLPRTAGKCPSGLLRHCAGGS